MNNGHPAWKPILDALPESLHSLIRPHLESWDKGVEARFAEIHKQYEGYKPFMDNNVDPRWLQQAAVFARNFEQDPEGIISKANETYKLGFITASEAEELRSQVSSQNNDTNYEDLDLDEDENMRLEDNPVVKQLLEDSKKMQEILKVQQEEQELDRNAQEFNEYLDKFLVGDKAHVSRDFVTALVAQGFTGEQAVEEFNKALANTVSANGVTNQTTDSGSSNNNEAPVIGGSAGTSGSGLPDGSIDFGGMSTDKLNETVEAMLKASEGN